MSSAVVPTSAALGRPFLFDAESEPEVYSQPAAKKPVGTGSDIAQVVQSTIKNQPSTLASSFGIRKSAIENAILPASRLEIRPAPELASSGIPALDALTGGLARGCLTELCGPASSGRTTVLLAALAAATRRGEYCALIDASDALDPHSAAAAGIDLDRLLWVRCNENSLQRHRVTEKAEKEKEKEKEKYTNSEHRLEQVLRTTDLLLESGGFGLIVLDLADIPLQDARRIPLTTWFRFRRAVEHKPTILLAIEQQPIAGSCSSLLLQLGNSKAAKKISGEPLPFAESSSSREAAEWESPARQCRGSHPKKQESHRDDTENTVIDHASRVSAPPHANLLTGINIQVELTRSRLERKPAHSIAFETRTAWTG